MATTLTTLKSMTRAELAQAYALQLADRGVIDYERIGYLVTGLLQGRGAVRPQTKAQIIDMFQRSWGTQVRIEPVSGRAHRIVVTGWSELEQCVLSVDKVVGSLMDMDEAVTDLCLAYGIQE